MAVVAVSADNTRIAEAFQTNDTGTWGNDGGGGGVANEPDFYYQGSESQSRKVSTSRVGRSYDAASTEDLTATDRRHILLKLLITNKDALLARTAPAAGIKIGSADNQYYEYYVFGNDNYPKRGGFQLLAISPNVSGYIDDTVGSPVLGSSDYYSFLADFSATSKSENVIIDAIDVGAGLVLVGGDGADTDGVYNDFVSADEGTTANSWGYVFTEGNAIFVTGRLAIGENTAGTAVATVFIDSDAKLEWTNGYVETGFNAHRINLGSATTVVTLTRCNYDCAGRQNNDADRGYTTTEDSRFVFEVIGTSGSITMANCVIQNAASVDLTSACTLDVCNIINSGQIDANGADLSGTNVLVSAVAADTGALLWNSATNPSTLIDGMTFTKGTNAHHAIEFGTSSSLTINLNDITFENFDTTNGNTTANDSVLYFQDTGADVTWTVNVSNVTGNISYKKARATDTVNIVQSVTVTINVFDVAGNNIDGAQVGVFATNDGTEIINSSTVSGTVSGFYGGSTPRQVKIWIRKASSADNPRYKNFSSIQSIGANGLSFDATLTVDTLNNATT